MNVARRQRALAVLLGLLGLVLVAGSTPLPRGGVRVTSLSSSPPETTVVFGPGQFTCGSPTWTVKDTSFDLSNYDVSRRYEFRITNGDPNGTHRVAQVSLCLNDQELMNAADVTSTVAYAVKRAEPLESNALTVGVKKGSTGSHIRLDLVSIPDPSSYRIHGPATHTRASTPAGWQEFDGEFTKSDSARGPYTLILTNGDPDGTHRVTGGILGLNGDEVISSSEFGSGTARLTRRVALDSLNDYSLSLAGSTDARAQVEVTATDSTAPRLALLRPATDTLLVDSSRVTISGSVSDETPGTVQVNSLTAHVTSDTVTTYFADSLALSSEGAHTVTVHAANRAGYSTELVRTVIRDTHAPTLTVPEATSPTTDSLWIVSGSWSDITHTVVEVDGEPVAVGTAGTFVDTLDLDVGPNGIFFRATDALGHTTSFKRYVFRTLVGEGAPPDSTVTPSPLNATTTTPFLDQVSFLFTGENGSQQQYDVVPDSLRPEVAAVVRGRVTARDFGALPNVTVRVLGHDEFGYTATRADGQFDLVVNGGAPLTLRFSKPGYLEAQRACLPAVNEFAIQDTVALIGKSRRVHVVQLDSLQVVHGRFSTDANGDREIRVLFQGGTVARIARAPGDTAALTDIRLRLTEYTVGADGAKAMPALLPPATAYTYCVDFSVDEADSIGRILQPTLPAPDVVFSKPVVFYVPNFLDYPVGTVVPYGYYDRRNGRWVAGRDARIIQVLGDSAGTAALDVSGDGSRDSTSTLDSLGIGAAELQVLAAQYRPGAVLCRTSVDRFSNADCNFSVAPLTDYVRRPGTVPHMESKTPEPCEIQGSIIECEDRTLGERVPVSGTPYSLNYRSFRAPGDAVMRTIRVPVIGETVPNGLQGVIVNLDVAGKQYSVRVPGPITSATEPVTLVWDGRDAYGRFVDRAITAKVSVGYVFPLSIAGGSAERLAKSFGNASYTGGMLGLTVGDRAVGQIVWNRQSISLGVPGTAVDGLGGWTLSPHHTFDPTAEGAVYLGDGGVLPVPSHMWHNLATGLCDTAEPDSGELLSVYPTRVAYGPNGALYIADDCRYSVLRVDRSGMVRRIAGTNQRAAYSGDGPARERSFPNRITGLAIGPDGSVYVASSNDAAPDQSLVCVVTPDGMIHKVIGGRAGYVAGGGDGLPTEAAWTGHISSLALGPDGSLFLGECNGPSYSSTTDFRVRRIGTDGTITDYAGAGGSSFSDTTGRATLMNIGRPEDLEVDRDGALYIAEGRPGLKVRRVTPQGIMSLFFDGYPAVDEPEFQSAWCAVYDIALAPDGAIYLLTRSLSPPNYAFAWGRLLLRCNQDGTVEHVYAYSPSVSLPAEAPGPMDATSLVHAVVVTCSPENKLVLGGHFMLWKESPPLTENGLAYSVPSKDGSEVYVFATQGDSAGRHLYTRDGVTGGIRYRFGYDAAGRLASIRDAAGLATTIGRDGNGVPLWIDGPYGHRTTLSLDANGYLSEMSGPLDATVTLTTSTSGLLESYTDAVGNQHTFTYASDGRLAEDWAPLSTGIQQQLSTPDVAPNAGTDQEASRCGFEFTA